MPLTRLDKLISDTGLCSRRQAREYIRQGRAAVDGVTDTDPAHKLESTEHTVTVDGHVLDEEEHIYIMMNKKGGILTAARDKRQPTVLDGLPAEWKRRGVSPVGRLDKDTTGLLILTDDGPFSHRVISPKAHVSKLYEALVDGTPSEADREAFQQGIVLKDGTKCLPADLIDRGNHIVRVEVFEGKYHQVKRMLSARMLPVVELKRLRIGGLWLDETLAPGEYRRLSREEVLSVGPDLLSK